MKLWKCSIESKDGEGNIQTIDLDFADYNEATETNVVLKTEFFEELLTKANNNDIYTLSGGLVSLKGPDNVDYSQHSFFVILGLDTRNLLLGILLGELDDHTFKYVGFYPPFIKDEVKEDVNALRGLPVLLLDKEDIWQSVNIIAPSIKNDKVTKSSTE